MLRHFTQPLLILLITYVLLIGSTFNGMLNPEIKLISTIIISFGAEFWLIIRTRNSWRWHRTPLDGALLLWALAFALSSLLNLDQARRIMLGLWYMGLYIAVWYALADALMNRAIKRETLIDGLIVTAAFVILFGWGQVYANINTGLVRPGSVIGNPNSLAAFLILTLPFILERMGTHRQVARAVMTVMAVLAITLFLLTQSRSAFLAFGAAVAARVAVYAYEHKLHTREGRQAFRERLTTAQKRLLAFAVAAGVFVVAGVAVFLIYSLTIPGRTLDLRSFIYDSAITLFAEQPIAGHGVFTFGGGLVRLNSTPPTEPHSHAHNLILHTAAENGIVGLAALAFTLIVITRAVLPNLNRFPASDKRILRPGIAALVGFGAHHLLDLPAMMPAIFLMMVIILSVCAIPNQPSPLRRPTTRLAASALVVTLILTGWLGTITYSMYIDALRGVTVSSAGERADKLNNVIALDPLMPVYHQQQGYLYALAGDYARAAEAYERYTQLAPEYVAGWGNLSALYAALGRTSEAVQAMNTAISLAPEMGSLQIPLERIEQGTFDPQPPADIDPFVEDISFNVNINQIQFLRLALPRQFLPLLHFSP